MRTYGYDYAYALSIAEVNAILTKNLATVDMEIPYSVKDPDSGTTVTLNAKLEPWQIVKGGSNSLLNFEIPFSQGYLALEGGALKPGSYLLAGVSVIMQISLGWIGSSNDQSGSGNKNRTSMVFLPNQTKDKDNPGYVASIKVMDPNNNLDSISKGILKEFMADALVSNKGKIKYIFANVNPQPPNVSTWLNPVQWEYFYLNNGEGALCFLCMLSNAALPSNPAFDSTAISSSYNSTLLVSQESFFSNVVVPSIKSAFSNGTFNLKVENEVCTISNSGNFKVKTSDGGITAKSFTLTTSNQGNGLATTTSGGGSLKFLFGLASLPNASYQWSLSTVNKLQYKNQQVTFLADPKPTKTHSQTIHWYDWVLLVVLGITNIAGLVSAIVDSINDFSDQVDAVGMGNINTAIQKATGNSVVNLSGLISWNKQGESFEASEAALDGAFYIRGTLNQ